MSQKVVVVTGGAQGIGLAVAETYLRAGHMVYIADSDMEAGEEALERLAQVQKNAHFVPTDVRKEDDIRKLIAQIEAEQHRLDVVVNNAGVGTNQPIEQLPVEAFDNVLAINLRAPFMMAKYAAPLLRKAVPGNIINIASTRALMSEADTEPYSASKGGIVALTHALSISLGPDVRVNAISPGWIEVSDWKKSSERQTPNHRPEDLSQHPVGRVGTPYDIGHACVFLTSNEASFITGQNLVIDGGMTVKMIYEP